MLALAVLKSKEVLLSFVLKNDLVVSVCALLQKTVATKIKIESTMVYA